MRIVNAMIFGNSLNNIHRNVRHVNELVQQIETKKLIQRPSDNPILAARSLRYRTILEETQQFLSNANAGMSWMETSESAFMNLLQGEDAALQEINRRLVAASTGSHTLDNRLAMVTEMREFFDQIKLEMNQTYMGRHVFSGFFANQPPILNADMTGRSFLIHQNIYAAHIQTTMSFQNIGTDGTQPLVRTTNIINLPFRDMDFLEIPGFNVIRMDARDPLAYAPEATSGGLPVLHFIPETGELVMHADTARDFPADVAIRYRVDGPRAGQLNPMVYFRSQEVEYGTNTYLQPINTHTFDTADHHINMEMATANHVTVNSLAREIVTPAMFADLLGLFEFVENLTPSDERAVRAYFLAQGLTGQNLENTVSTFMSDEAIRISDALHSRFTNLLGAFADHTDVVQREHTSLGSRMNRVEMLVTRLEEEEINYTALLSANEDTPLQQAILRRSAAEAAFTAALRANAMIVQLGLVNFLSR